MKRLLIVSVFLSNGCLAQLVIRPSIFQNNFQIYYNKGQYSYGGQFGASSFVPTLDLEYRFGKELDSLSTSWQMATNPRYGLITGISIWNYLNTEKGMSLKGDDLFSSYRSRFVSVPLMLKYYLQVGVLNENMRLGWGLGAIGLYRLKTELHEEATIYIRDSQNVFIGQQFVEDTRDITKSSMPLTFAWCIELSFEYGRFYLSFRAWRTLGDQYVKSITGNWKVPYNQSIYLQAYDKFPQMIFTGGGLLIGFRITSLKPH